MRAAESLGISQPALSRSIARLEKQLGLALFERHGQGIRPTIYAEHIRAHAEQTLADVSTLVDDIHQLAHGDTGEISIGLGAAARAILAAPLAAKLVERFPKLRIAIINGRAPDLIARLMERELDIVITTPQIVPKDSALVCTELFRDSACFFARPRHPLLRKKVTPSLGEILDYPLALPGVTRAMIANVARFDEAKQRNLTAYVTHDYGLIRKIVEHSNAIGQAPVLVYPEHFASGTIVPIPRAKALEYSCIALTLRVSMQSPVICTAVELARQAADELISHPKARACSA